MNFQPFRAMDEGWAEFKCFSLQFLLPLLIEKLDSELQSAKLDSLQTLVRRDPLLLSAYS